MWSPAQALLALSLLISLIAPVLAQTSTATTTATAITTPPVCPYRTVNYITHGLPQQCLASSRKGVTSSATTANVPLTNDITSTTVSTSETLDTTPTVHVSTPAPVTSSTITETTTASPTSTDPVQSTASPPRTEEVESSTSTTPDETDEDSPLEDGKFLSFEDWKRENLIKSGQSEHVGKGPGVEGREPRKRAPIAHDSLDSFGDDTEIDLDFSGFVSDGLDPPNQGHPLPNQEARESRSSDSEPGPAPRAGARSKDAGTTCKERYNYASYDCAAIILKTNPEAKSPSAVLGNNKDSYMLNECSAQNKFLILELCDDISIDTIVIANFEFFSSTFRTFRVSVSDKYPVKIDKWKTLGTFEARNSREVQAFLVENPVIWARYLRIEFLTHYGNEYYCPVSLVRVHGTTMMEEYKHDLDSLHADDEDEKGVLEDGESYEEDGLVPEAVAEQLLTKAEPVDASDETVQMTDLLPDDPPEETSGPTNASQTVTQDIISITISTSPPEFSAFLNDSSIEDEIIETCKPDEEAMNSEYEDERPPGIQPSDKATTTPSSSVTQTADMTEVTLSDAPTSSSMTTTSASHTAKARSEAHENSSLSNSPSSTTVNSTKTATTATQSAPPAPTIQESFFKSVQKRLQMLEANSSLSLQYIEEQSRSLRDAFLKVEQRQLAKTTSFLEYLNSTVLAELRDFRQQYDQLWQSTVIELEMQRERYERENLAINARLGVLADELIFQKRMSVLYMVLVLICLGLVLFSKGNLNSYWELPLVQSVLARTPTSRRGGLLSGLDTPSPAVTRENSTGGLRKRQGILKAHQRLLSMDSIDDGMSPTDPYSPPTPVSFGDPSSDLDDKDDSNRLGDPQYDPSLIERPSTSPPMLPGTEASTFSEVDGDSVDGSIDAILQRTPPIESRRKPPILVIEGATPPPKHLSWKLPDD